MLMAASLAIRWLPFRRVAAMAGDAGAISGQDAVRAARVAWAVEAGARRLPWRIVCFQKGLSAHWMLRRRGLASVLRYGVRQSADTGLEAHVWVTSGAQDVIGCEVAGDFAEVARFPG